MNYFSIICFVWAFVGIFSRILMIVFKKNWTKWELKSAYSEEKPSWIYVIAVLAFVFVGYTWYQVYTTSLSYTWIIALLISLTLIKILALLFKYDEFRKFAKETLNDPKKMLKLNISVLVFSLICILLGVFLY